MKRISLILIFIFLLLMMAGISAGEPERLLNLSTQVCLECIGIG